MKDRPVQNTLSQDGGCEKNPIGLMRWYIQHRMHIYPSLDALRHLEVTAVLVVRQVRQRNLAPEIRSEESVCFGELENMSVNKYFLRLEVHTAANVAFKKLPIVAVEPLDWV